MRLKIILGSVSAIIISLVQISFIGGLPFPFSELNILIIFLVFFQANRSKAGGVWMFFLCGLLFDMLILPSARVFWLVWPLVFIFSRFLFNKVFTNRSLFSLLTICFMDVLFFSFVYYSIFWIFGFIGLEGMAMPQFSEMGIILGWRLAINTSAVFLLFYTFNLLSKSFKPVLMIRR